MSQRKTNKIRADKEFCEIMERELPGLSWQERTALIGNPEKYERLLEKAKKFIGPVRKKGSFFDWAIVLLFAIVLSVAFLFGYTMLSSVNAEIQASDVFGVDEKAQLQTDTTDYADIAEGAYLLFMVLVSMAVLALAVLVRVHPVFLGFYLLALVVLIILGATGSNIYDDVSTTAELTSYSADLPIIAATMTYLPIIVGVLGTVLAALMFKSWSAAQ